MNFSRGIVSHNNKTTATTARVSPVEGRALSRLGFTFNTVACYVGIAIALASGRARAFFCVRVAVVLCLGFARSHLLRF